MKNYVKPTITVIEIEQDDIILASPPGFDNEDVEG